MPHWQLNYDRRPVSRAAFYFQRSIEQGCAFVHSYQAKTTEFCGSRRTVVIAKPVSVVLDDQHDRVLSGPEQDADVGRVCVLENVVQSLLDDPVKVCFERMVQPSPC